MRLLPRFPDRWLQRRIPPAPSVQLDQRRIFIMPTLVGLAYVGALLLMLIAAINYQNSLAYGLTFLLGALFVVAILHTWRNLAGLLLMGAGSTPVFASEPARLRVRLESRGRAHQAIRLGWSANAMQEARVAAAGASEVELAVPSARRGWLRPGRLRVESRFPLGILVAWSWVDLQLATLIYPRPLPGEPPKAARSGEDSEETAPDTAAGVDDFEGLKPWQPGDSRRRLNWKAYSRGHGLLVKEFSEAVDGEILLALDGLPGDLETRLSQLCQAVLELSALNQAFTLQLGALRIGPDAGAAHRESCLRALALHGTEGAA
jgi:uncharacterized protein (DUF58 family)